MTSRVEVDYCDLLGLPFEWGGDEPARGVDCWWVTCQVVMRATGVELPAPPFVSSPASLQAWGRTVGVDWLTLVGRDWRAATALGDVLATSDVAGGPAVHVAPVVRLAPRLVLQVGPGGLSRAVLASRVPNVVGVWRALTDGKRSTWNCDGGVQQAGGCS